MSSVVLYWDIGSASWTTEARFTPNSNSGTLGGQWFSLPPNLKKVGPNRFQYNFTNTDASQNATGFGGIRTLQRDTTDTGTTSFKGKISMTATGDLQTEAGSLSPFVNVNGGDYHLTPVLSFRPVGRRQ